MLITQLDINSYNNHAKTCDTLGCANSAKAVLWNSYPEPEQFACEQCETQARETQEFPKTR